MLELFNINPIENQLLRHLKSYIPTLYFWLFPLECKWAVSRKRGPWCDIGVYFRLLRSFKRQKAAIFRLGFWELYIKERARLQFLYKEETCWVKKLSCPLEWALWVWTAASKGRPTHSEAKQTQTWELGGEKGLQQGWAGRMQQGACVHPSTPHPQNPELPKGL